MDALFADTLGETAVVQVHTCDDDATKGKGVFALVHLSQGDVALRDAPMAFVGSADVTAAAVDNKADVNAKQHNTCATCGYVRSGGRRRSGLWWPSRLSHTIHPRLLFVS
jgi:hypothetical protein